MKQGDYFFIPECPRDMERLWNESQPLRSSELPAWIEGDDPARYRLVDLTRFGTRADAECDEYSAELGELELCGLVVERHGLEPRHNLIYITDPYQDSLWSIGIYLGNSPFRWRPAEVVNPVLTRDHVTDVPAAFVADPFMTRAGDRWYMFFEVMNWRTGKGEIGLAVSNDALTWSYQQIVLAEPFHLSYPFVFTWMGDHYMIPESHQAGSIRLYKAEDFPMGWSHVATLLDGPYLVDATVVRHDGMWWLFTETNPDRAHDTLRLFWSDALSGHWHEHPSSPVAEHDPAIARPAGRPLPFQGTLWRFAQNCASAYGTDVRAIEITELTRTTYRERQVHSSPILAPSGSGWNACGMHHIDPHPLNDRQWVACVDGWRTANGGNHPDSQSV
jgi:hypothetical protein